ncbi:Type I phosphodiesterase / nucleotide pyrophosphatase [Psychrobacillus sp. OK028]|uniref:alkaline phosphatase family protein n=1 Tax=Psychrobacillus sp. OK028 TaxID=1884359 RepID=UPI000885ADDD|nr:alkaline phosphatase family protein [Psychrobacillus sp. OK028]SDN12963.1 Type I phosphodiesterase / nucleotide pyrophosphatase [Psychrobacillus sp. OK028]
MKRKIVIGLITFIFICSVLVLAISISPTKELDDISINSTKKPIILVAVDSLMSEPLQKAVKQGKAPAFSFLINNGHINPEMISSYPTMSVTIDSTLLTGTYPNQHKVPGLIWFKEDENRMISYGSGISEIWNNGVKNISMDSVIHLNENHLSKEVLTIHEELATRKLSSASINGLLFRGSVQHQLNVPKLISTVNLLPKEIEINGPTLFSLGLLSQYNSKNDWNKFVWNRLGVNNKFSANELKYLIEQKKLPSFTLTYLPDADASVHKHGPDDLKGIEKADEALQDILNSFSSWEEAIQEVTWIVLGDSGQSFIKKEKETSLIDLNNSLKNYTFWEGEKRNVQLAIAINERMAYIYVNDKQVELSEITDILKKDKRIGIIAWKDEQTNYVVSPLSDEEFTFSPKGKYVDEYEQSWDIAGNASILDLKMTNGGRIQYQNYPDALARLYGALHSQEGRVIIVDARPSYEFIEKHSHDHAGGGAHGSLHKVDSIVPIIVTGTNDFPEYNRLVDVKEWILQLLEGT